MEKKPTRREYFSEKYQEIAGIYWMLTDIINEMREEFGIEEELCDMTERTELEEKMYQEIDLPAYKIFDSFETDLETWIELAEQYDEENE